jgi:nucleotide-binding universal stress UspA family protein
MKGMMRTILVPHDLSKHADRALRIAAGLAAPHGRLIVLYVVNEFRNVPFQTKVLAEGRRDLARAIRATLGPRPRLPIEQQVVAGNPYREITRAARRADCIVMCTLGRTGLAHLVIGSVAEKVVRHAPIPVLTFGPGAGTRFLRGRRRPVVSKQLRAA